MNTTPHCPRCGTPLPADLPHAQCPKCMLGVGLGSQTGGATEATETGSPPPSPADLAPHFPQLEILELLGQGGMGIVYKARQPRLDRYVALKILPVDASASGAFAERFSREARTLARLTHPNIVGVYDFGEADGIFYLIMEYVDGANLRELERLGRLGPLEALKVVPAICDALQYAHDQGVIHRDIKPENVLLDQQGRVKIADFGLAKILGRPASELALTRVRQVMGTPNYMAPEQLEHPLEVDHRADIYSLGVVIYEMLTGELPIGHFEPPSQRVQIDARFDQVVLRALAKDRERRYQQVSEVKTDVQSIASRPEPKPKTPPTVQRSGNGARKFFFTTAGIFLIGCGALLLLVVGLLLAYITLPAIQRAIQHAQEMAAIAGDSELIRSFSVSDPTLSPGLTVTNGAWLLHSTNAQTVRLFEVPDPGIENAVLIYRAELKTEDLQGQAYLEMLCQFPRGGEFFSRGLNEALSGSKEWRSYQTPFILRKGERPERVLLNLVVQGSGKVWIRNPELRRADLP